jgi:putative sigma-54 modulation protein
MNILIKGDSKLQSPAISDFVQHRFLKLSRRFGIQRLVVRLSDLNGPKGGVDKECLVELKVGSKLVIVKERGAELYSTLSTLSERIGEVVQRIIDRQNSRSKRHRRVLQGMCY